MGTYKNTFEKGAQIGVHPWVQQQGTATVLENARLLSKENSGMVVQAMPSTVLLESLPAGALLYASANYNGIAYLILHYPETGISEIGSYPSPNYAGAPVNVGGTLYAANQMLPRYAAFQNLKKTGESFYSAFSTTALKLSQENDVSMTIQPDYDGTVNVIFTDGENPIRLINSRFSLLPDDKFEIIDRTGTSDTNLYAEESLDSLLRLILESSSVVKANLQSVEDGGSLKAGNYKYYFSYENADGNTTDTVAESGLISVFLGDTIGSVYGGKENQNTNRQVRLRLTGLDLSYTKVRVYFAYAAGDVTAQTTLFQLANAITFSKSDLVFTHSGGEPIQATDITVIQKTYAAIDTVRSIAQIGSYLVGANVKEKKRDPAELAGFAKKVFAANGLETMVSLESRGLSDEMKELYNLKTDQENPVGNGFYNNGYANPKNIAERLGYHDGESYAFGIVYIFADGSLSQVFPITGIDNLNFKYVVGPGGYYIFGSDGPPPIINPNAVPTVGNATVAALVDNFDVNNNGLNTLGIVRFPRRNATHMPPLVLENNMSINSLSVNVPAEKPEGTVGCFFVRAPRVPDKIAQGYVLPTWRLLRNEVTFYGHNDTLNPAAWNIPANYRVLPTSMGIIEVVKSNTGPAHRVLRMRKQEMTQNDNLAVGNGTGRADRKQVIDKSRIAFICPDSFGNPTELLQILNERDVSVDAFGKAYTFTAAPKDLQNILFPDFQDSQIVTSVIQTREVNAFLTSNNNRIEVPGKIYYMPKNSNATNNGGFTSRSEGYFGFTIRRGGPIVDGARKKFFHLLASYDDYFGIVIHPNPTAQTLLGERMGDLWQAPTAQDGFGGGAHNNDGSWFAADSANVINQFGYTAYVANIYDSDGPIKISDLKQVYGNTEALAYQPISQRMLWSELEAELDVNRNIKLYGGDCYTTISFRRIYHTNLDPAAQGDESQNDWFGPNEVRARAGQVITLCTQNNNNTYLRGIENALLEGKKQVWLPRMDGAQSDVREWRQPAFMKPEPALYNRGYTGIPTGRRYQAFPASAPYIANHWFNRIIYLGPHVVSNFANAYRQWTGTSYQDYETQFGQIIAVKTVNNNLACIWETAAGFIPFLERTYGGSSETGQVFVEQSQVLGPRAQIISGLYGSRHPASLVATDNALFGVDALNKKIWMLTPEGLNHFSDHSVHPLLEKFAGGYANRQIRQGSENIVGGFNAFFGEVWFTYLSKSEPAANFTLVFNEKYASQGMVQFSGQVSIMAYRYLTFGDGMLSLSAKSDSHVIWQHDRYDQGFMRLHGQPVDFKLGFVVNNDAELTKIFKHLMVNSNSILPVRVNYATDGNASVQEIVPYTGANIIEANARYTNGAAMIPIADTQMVTNDPVRAFLRQSLGNYGTEAEVDANLQGRALEVILTYRGGKPVEILSVITDTHLSV